MKNRLSVTRAARPFFRSSVSALLSLSFAAAAVGGVAARGVFAQGTRAPAAQAASPAQRTPSDAVRHFYRLMRERRFNEALTASIYRPAVEGLSAKELDELRPDFERMAAEAPASVELTGEQMSGDDATVFMKLGDGADVKVVPIFLIREKGGPWIVGDRENQKIIKKLGKKFFFETRIEVHHDDVENMLKRISTAQLIYSAQNAGAFGDLNALVRAGLVPQDILSTDSTGYRFRVAPAPGGKGWSAGAEPARYGSTGRFSFALDQSGNLKKEDKGGKPLKGS